MAFENLSNNDILSDRLKVKPLKDGETVEYRLIKADEIDRARVSDQFEPGAGRSLTVSVGDNWLAEKENIIDPFAVKNPDGTFSSRRKMIMNIISASPNKLPSGETKMEPILDKLKFDDGKIFCNNDNFETYIFCERSNKNISNSFRDKRVRALFYRIERGDIHIKKVNDWDLRYDAMSIVKFASQAELKAMFQKVPSNLTKDLVSNVDNLSDIKVALMNVADQFPLHIMKIGGDEKARTKVAVIDAERYDVLVFDSQARTYFFNHGGKEPIYTVEIGENRLDALVDFFIEDKKARAFLWKEMKTIYDAYNAVG